MGRRGEEGWEGRREDGEEDEEEGRRGEEGWRDGRRERRRRRRREEEGGGISQVFMPPEI